MSVNATEAAKPACRDTHTFEVWQLNSAIIANHDVLHVTLAIDEHTDLSASLV
jgi:hypothetical protein